MEKTLLFCTITPNSAQNHLLYKLQTLESVVRNSQNPLDHQITEEELLAKIQAPQPRKAGGPDAILNDMLKFSNHKLKIAILKSFYYYYLHLEQRSHHTNL